ncbi:MAG: cell wall hydrolase [Bradyrhizobium sp.]|nr:cell wall hydrolase [Bradyrhizobium sp.]
MLQTTDGLDKPGGSPVTDVFINEIVTTTGVTKDEFVEVDLNNGTHVWLKSDELKPVDPAARVAADRASFVVECIVRERERNEIAGTGPWFVSADFLIARALIETTIANMAPQPNSLAAGPMLVTPAEWGRFLQNGGAPTAGLKVDDYDRWLTQVKGAAFTMFSHAKAFSDVQQGDNVGAESSAFLPTYLDIFHAYLFDNAKAAVAVFNARNDDAAKDRHMDVLLGGILSPAEIATLLSTRAKYLGSPGVVKTVTEFIQSTEIELRGALKVALDLIVQHAPDELPSEPDAPATKRVAKVPTDVAPVPAADPAPFATINTPLEQMFWPIVTDDPQAMVVSYLSDNGQVVGSSSRRFFADRRNGERHHVGMDIFCREGDVVVACAPGKIVAFYNFYRRPTTGEDTFALFVAHDGVVINYGEVRRSSRQDFGWNIGDKVTAGQKIARVSGTNMIHFETYVPNTVQNSRWLRGQARPASLLNPTMLLLTLASGASRIDKNGVPSISNGSAKIKPAVGDPPQDEDLLTLARTIYGEARSQKEPASGRQAVAHVVMTRLRKKWRGATTITQVCRSNRQFSCWNDNDANKKIIEAANRGINPVFDQCYTFAEQVANGQLEDNTGDATHYYSETIARPNWAKPPAKQTTQVGSHLFFRNVD